MNNIHTGNNRGYSSSDMSTMLNKVPIVTRWLIGAIVLQTIVTRLGILPLEKTFYHFVLSAKKFQFWRPVSACFILPARSLPAVFDLYTIYSRSTDLEQRRNTMDYIFYLWFCVTSLGVIAVSVFGSKTFLNLETSFKFILSYTWSVDNANARVVYFGLFPILAKYIPLMELFLAFLFNEDYIGPLMGMAVAYLFQCLDTRSYGPIYGSLRNIHGYGFAPIGQFGMPRFIRNFFSKKSSKNKKYAAYGEGRKLGSNSTSSEMSSSSSLDRESSAATGSSLLHHEVRRTTGPFPGKGRRLGN